MKYSKNTKKVVILITIDALRKDHLSSYNYKRKTDPNLKKFSRDALKFNKAYTNGPETPSAFSALFSSQFPYSNGGFSPLPIQKVIFPQILQENGINTYAIHSNPNLGRFFNYHRGFDTFLDGERYKSNERNNHRRSLKHYFIKKIKKKVNFRDIRKKLMYTLIGFNKIKNWLRKKIPKLTDLLLPFTPIAYNAPYITEKLIKFLNNNSAPIFIWAHYMDVHSPFNPPDQDVEVLKLNTELKYNRGLLIDKIYNHPSQYNITQEIIENLKALYDAEIHFVDRQLKNFFSFLEYKFKKNCLIIITADHGESFFEHGYFNHQGNVFEELLEIPLIMKQLGRKPNKNIFNDPVQLLDIAPTILDFYDIKIPEYYKGQSLLPFLKGESINPPKYIFSETYQKEGIMKRNHQEGYILLSIKKGEWKYIFDEEKGKELLFNLKYDKEEENNVIEKKTKIAEEFREVRKTHLKKIAKKNELSKITKAIDKIDMRKIKL